MTGETSAPCAHKWISYQFVENANATVFCELCGIDKQQLPKPVVQEIPHPKPIEPVLERGYGT